MSIQQVLCNAILKVTGEQTMPTGSGRTDSGVHALAQVCHVHLATHLDAPTLHRAINAHLPQDIRVKDVVQVEPTFDACRDATSKHYRYVIFDEPIEDVFLRHFHWHIHRRLDVAAMAQASGAVIGKHDFRCFETEFPNRATSVRTVFDCQIRRIGREIFLDIIADGFLYNMVRAIAGTLVEIGRGKRPVTDMARIIDQQDRTLAGPTAPAHGLFLVRVGYGQVLTITNASPLERFA